MFFTYEETFALFAFFSWGLLFLLYTTFFAANLPKQWTEEYEERGRVFFMLFYFFYFI